MNTQIFEISVVQYPGIKLLGMVVRTDMRKASFLCPELWERFGMKMKEACGREIRHGHSYGVSVMIDADAGIFDYWAATPLPQKASVPPGLQALEIPAGDFARCTVPSLSLLRDAYDYLYNTWAPGQDKYSPDLQKPCFELYTEEYQKNGNFEVYVPVRPQQPFS